MTYKDKLLIYSEKATGAVLWALSAVALGTSVAFEAKGIPSGDIEEIAIGGGLLSGSITSGVFSAVCFGIARETEQELRSTVNSE